MRRRKQILTVHPRHLLMIAFLCFACTAAALALELKLRPLVESYAEGRAGYIATRAINQAIQEELEASGDVYDRLIFFEKNESGEILAVKTDSIAVNRFRTAVLDRITVILNDTGATRIEVPLGNLINGELFTGRGPRIVIQLQLVNNAAASFISQFEEAGINQTRHRLLLEFDVTVTALLPAGRASFHIPGQINLAETILIGKVPETYTNITDPDDDIYENLGDF